MCLFTQEVFVFGIFSYVGSLIVSVIGCVNGINPHLSELVPFLITSLGDKKVRVFRFVFTAVLKIRGFHWVIKMSS